MSIYNKNLSYIWNWFPEVVYKPGVSQESQINTFKELYTASNEKDQPAYKQCGVLVAAFDGGRKRESLDLGELFTLQTLRSTNQPGALTAVCENSLLLVPRDLLQILQHLTWVGIWKREVSSSFILDQCPPGHPPALQGNCPQSYIPCSHWCQPPNPDFLPSCRKVLPWEGCANKHLQLCFIQL